MADLAVPPGSGAPGGSTGGSTAPGGPDTPLPARVRVFGADGEIALARPDGEGWWAGRGAAVQTRADGGVLVVRLLAATGVSRIQLRWPAPGHHRYLGDHWERSYGDLEWRGEAAERVMPWYVLGLTRPGPGSAGHGRTDGYGVEVGAGALCFWTADADGLSLWADVRCGGVPVELDRRVLDVCRVVHRRGIDGESPFQAHRALCRRLCPQPRLPDHPVHGTNDWHVLYGNNSADAIARSTDLVSRLSPDPGNRPYSVIDDGWSQGGPGTGPWYGNARFGEMAAVAARLRDLGARPGIWYRPLTPLPRQPAGWRLPTTGCLDPSRPEVLEVVREHVARLVGWGYRMLKHDFTAFDTLGRWGFAMGASVTDDGWSFHDRGRTTAEITLDLYRAIRAAADAAAPPGDPCLVIGCNTVGHLAAGQVELQRIGDDTSGRSWNRTRRMGVNALAFRAAQHGTFFAVDADIAPVTPQLPWPLARQWLDLVARSGTPLFVAVSPEAAGPDQVAALGEALARAAAGQPLGEPLDWLDTTCPARWRLGGAEVAFRWQDDAGGWPFGD